jgi:hypothetical protein
LADLGNIFPQNLQVYFALLQEPGEVVEDIVEVTDVIWGRTWGRPQNAGYGRRYGFGDSSLAAILVYSSKLLQWKNLFTKQRHLTDNNCFVAMQFNFSYFNRESIANSWILLKQIIATITN